MQANVGEAYKYLEDDYDTTLTKLSITQTAYRFGKNILIAILFYNLFLKYIKIRYINRLVSKVFDKII